MESVRDILGSPSVDLSFEDNTLPPSELTVSNDLRGLRLMQQNYSGEVRLTPQELRYLEAYFLKMIDNVSHHLRSYIDLHHPSHFETPMHYYGALHRRHTEHMLSGLREPDQPLTVPPHLARFVRNFRTRYPSESMAHYIEQLEARAALYDDDYDPSPRPCTSRMREYTLNIVFFVVMIIAVLFRVRNTMPFF